MASDPGAPSRAEIADLDAVLERYGRRREGEASVVSAGTLNRNFRVATDRGPVFARRHRDGVVLDRVHREHEVIRWASERDVPAMAPLAASDGATVVEIEGGLWALFPWIEGRTLPRGEATPREVEALGEMHGRVRRALVDHPESSGAGSVAALREALHWDTAESLAALDAIEPRVRADPERTHLEEGLAVQRRLLEGGAARPLSDFESLPRQLLHGDFHEQQVLVDADGAVVAVVDWEMVRVAPRVWELIRSLSYSLVLETELVDDYLRGFRRHVSLTAEECRAGVELWWQTRLHSTWVWEAYFLEGNERVGELLADTDAHLRRFADEGWRAAIADRLVAGSGAG
jgi:Ser/Thr protein kinase RdoA (MazF antagonist)